MGAVCDIAETIRNSLETDWRYDRGGSPASGRSRNGGPRSAPARPAPVGNATPGKTARASASPRPQETSALVQRYGGEFPGPCAAAGERNARAVPRTRGLDPLPSRKRLPVRRPAGAPRRRGPPSGAAIRRARSLVESGRLVADALPDLPRTLAQAVSGGPLREIFAPPGLPCRQDIRYLEIDTRSKHWRAVLRAGTLAVAFFPGCGGAADGTPSGTLGASSRAENGPSSDTLPRRGGPPIPDTAPESLARRLRLLFLRS